MKFTIEIARDNNDWDLYKEINTKLFSQVLDKIIKKYPNFRSVNNIELSILLTDDKRIKNLNFEFRNEDKVTNVLSFPDLEIDAGRIQEFKPDPDYVYLGDIAFAFGIIAVEAEEREVSFLQHFKHLMIHSILHLLGYDHQNDEEAETMQYIEEKVLEDFSIPSPY